MKIPKRFKLMGQTIEVENCPTLPFEKDSRGDCQFRHNKIRLRYPSDEWPVPMSQVEQTFFHELVHYIFYFAADAGHTDAKLGDDEYLVDRVANLLHQAFTTAED